MSKTVILIFSAVSLFKAELGAQAQEPFKENVPDAAWICVERPENVGVLNIYQTTILVSPNSKITLIGGEAGCLIVPAGNETISISFQYPYGPFLPPRFWTTGPQKFVTRAGSLTSFELCEAAGQPVNSPQWAATGWHNMWVLKRFGTNASLAPTPAKGKSRCAVR
jgi:hypothetical protein